MTAYNTSSRMRIHPGLPLLVAILIALVALQACRREGCTDAKAVNFDDKARTDDGSCEYSSPAFILHVKHTVDELPLMLLSKEYLNVTQSKYTVHRLQYYLSHIELKGAELSTAKVPFVYTDYQEGKNYTVSIPEAKEGIYDSLVFVFGLPGGLNKSHELPNDIENINMQWPDMMGGGYHYMKFEGRFTDTDSRERAFNIHLGRLVTDTLITNPMLRFAFPLNKLEYQGKTWKLRLNMNLNGWFDGPTPYDLNEFGGGIMMNHKAQRVLKENGMDLFELIEQWELAE